MTTPLLRTLLTCALVSIVAWNLAAQPMDIKFDRFEQWPGYPRQAVRAIGQDAQGFLLLTTPKGGVRFDGNVFEALPGKYSGAAVPRNPLTQQVTDRNGNVWTGERTTLRVDSPLATPRKYPLPAGAGAARAVFLHVEVSGDSVLWVLADSALLCFDMAKNRFSRDFRTRAHDVQSLYGAPFRCAFFSREGILWLGGETGLCKYDWRNQEFRHYNLNPGKTDKPGELNFVQGVAGDSSRCWVTTNDLGLLQYDLHKHCLLPEKISGDLKRLSQRGTYSMAYDKLGRLWVGNTSDSIFICDLKKNKIVHQIPQNGDYIHFIGKDVSLGHFWYLYKSTSKKPAMIRINQETLRIDTFWIPYWQNKPHQNRIDFFAPVKNDTVWFVHDTKFIEWFHPNPGRLGQKPIKAFSGIEPDMSVIYNLRYDAVRKRLWFMTNDSVYKLDWEKQTAVLYPNPHLKSGQMNLRIHTDDSGQLWVQGLPDNVLYKFDPERETFARYDWSDGLPNTAVECLDVDRVGKKWAQRYHDYTFLLFDPGKIPVIAANPPIITAIRPINQKSSLISGSGEDLTLAIKTTNSDLQITFTSVAFEQGRNLQFRYRLSGVDTAWVNAGPERVAYYSNLPPGDYHFLVMVANREGDWHPTAAEIWIEVQPPFYLQTWFRISGSLLLLGLLFAGFRYWEKRRIAQYQLRQRIAGDLHNEVETALNSISSLSAIGLLDRREDDLLERIEEQNATASEKLSDLVWFLNPENDSAAKMIQRICAYAQTQLSPLGIKPAIQVDQSANRVAMPIETRKAFYLQFKQTLKGLIEQNDFSTIRISISKENLRLKMEIALENRKEQSGLENKMSDNNLIVILSDG